MKVEHAVQRSEYYNNLELLTYIIVVGWFLARQDIVQESYCHDPGVGVCVGVRRQQYFRDYCRYKFETSHTDLISTIDPVYQVP